MSTLHGTLLQPGSATQCGVAPDAVVRFDDDGKIKEVGTDAKPGGDVVGGDGCWLLPGFIDAHLHLPQWDRRGIDGLPLFEWLDRVIYPAEARFTDEKLAERLAEDFVTGVVSNGTTTVAAFGSPFAKAVDKVFAVLDRRGMRAIYGMTLNDVNCPKELATPPDKGLDEARELAAKWHNKHDGLLQYSFNPRMVTSCSESLMRGAAALSDMMKCPIQTHVAESAAEEAIVREAFPENWDDVEVFADMGLLTSRSLLGHGVCLGEASRRHVAETRTAVVHCPTANLFLESGLMDYVAHRRAGIPIALGSSIAGGNDPFMPHVAIACLQTAKALKVHAVPRGSYAVPSPAEAWWLLTLGAAQALKMSDRVGSIETGKDADCLVVRPEPWIASLPVDQQVSALLYTLRPDQIEHVFIAGKRVGPVRAAV